MQIETSDLGDSVTRLKLTGRLDINGSAVAEIPIALAAKKSRSMIVDMSDVSYVASLGVRHLVMAAKALHRNGGRLVLFALTPAVAEILDTMRIGDIIPMVASEAEAQGLAAG